MGVRCASGQEANGEWERRGSKGETQEKVVDEYKRMVTTGRGEGIMIRKETEGKGNNEGNRRGEEWRMISKEWEGRVIVRREDGRRNSEGERRDTDGLRAGQSRARLAGQGNQGRAGRDRVGRGQTG